MLCMYKKLVEVMLRMWLCIVCYDIKYLKNIL